MSKTAISAILMLAMASFFLSACANKSSPTYASYYPDCREPLLEMQSEVTAASGALKGGVGGGMIGGVTGFFVGLLANGGNVAEAGIGAAVGAATGAMAGGISGGFSGSQGMGSARENRLLAKYYSEIDGDITGLDLRQAAGAVALQCYQKKLIQLEEMEKSDRITGEAATARKIEIEKGMQEARQLIGPDRGPTEPEQSQNSIAPIP